jgi:hypothetical protein
LRLISCPLIIDKYTGETSTNYRDFSAEWFALGCAFEWIKAKEVSVWSKRGRTEAENVRERIKPVRGGKDRGRREQSATGKM